MHWEYFRKSKINLQQDCKRSSCEKVSEHKNLKGHGKFTAALHLFTAIIFDIITSGARAPEVNEDCFAASAKRFRCKGARAPEFIISQKIKQLPGTMENRNRQVRNVNTQGGLLNTPVLTLCSVQRYEPLRVKRSESVPTGYHISHGRPFTSFPPGSPGGYCYGYKYNYGAVRNPASAVRDLHVLCVETAGTEGR